MREIRRTYCAPVHACIGHWLQLLPGGYKQLPFTTVRGMYNVHGQVKEVITIPYIVLPAL